MRAFTKIRFVVAALAAFALAPFSAHAQFVGGNASISATTASSNVGLPANTKTYPYAMIVPAEGSSNEVFYKLGTTSAITAATTSPALPSGGVCVNVGPNGYVAAITGTSTATVRISQLTLCPMFSGGSGGGGGGGGNVNLTGINGSAPSATNPLYVAPGTGATWAVTGTFWQATQPVSGTFWQATQPTSLASAQVASGAYASGSIGSGAMVDLGAQADAAAAADNSTASLIALLKRNNQNLTTLNTTVGSAIPAGSALIGKVGIDQTTPGTTNGVVVNAMTTSDPCLGAAKTNLPITSNTSALTQIIAASGSTKVYICSLAIISASAEWITFNTGTGTNCGTGTAGLIGGTTVGTNGLSLAANGGLTLGNGGGTVALTGAGGEVCVALSSTTYVTGNLTYVQQ